MLRSLLFATAFMILGNMGYTQEGNDPCDKCTEEGCKNGARAVLCAKTCQDQVKMTACTKGMEPEILAEIAQERMGTPAPAIDVK